MGRGLLDGVSPATAVKIVVTFVIVGLLVLAACIFTASCVRTV